MKITPGQLLYIGLSWAVIVPIIAFVPAIPVWLTVPLVLVGLIGITGMMVAVLLRVPTTDTLEWIVYTLLLGLASVLIGGLLINWLLPFMGVEHPLARFPLTVFFGSMSAVLSFLAYKKKQHIVIAVPIRSRVGSICAAVAPMFVVMSILGAEQLNNGRTNVLTIAMLLAIAVYVFCLVYWRKKIASWVYPAALYSISLALLLMYSLRSSYVIGWDINQEYEVFQTTLQHLVWHASYYPGLDYNACASITILPVILKQFTHVSSEYVFKFVFQMLFAAVPSMVFVLARRYVSEVLAFLAGFLFLSQTWFFEQMPALVRQETAFIFFMALLLVLFDEHLKKVTFYTLFAIAGIGIVLSHYSTAYITIIVIVIFIVLSYGMHFFTPFKKQPLPFSVITIAGSIAILLLWQVPATHTVGKFTTFLTHSNTVTINKPVAPPNTTPNQAVVNITVPKEDVPHQSWFQIIEKAMRTALFVSTTNPTTTDNSVVLAQQEAIRTYTVQPGYQFYPANLTAGYSSHAVIEMVALPERVPHYLALLVGSFEKFAKLIVVDVLSLVGIVAFYMEFRRTGSKRYYYSMVMALTAIIVLGTMIVVPYIQEAYNFTRLFLQLFLFLSVSAITGVRLVLKKVPHVEVWLTALLLVVFLSSTGVLDQFTGGPARLTLNQPPSTMDGLYIHDSEVAAARFLFNRNYADPVEGDAQANLRLQAFADMSSANTAIFPQTIDPSGYVYLISQNIQQRVASFQYRNNLITFNYPLDFLRKNKNLIYNSGGAEIYH